LKKFDSQKDTKFSTYAYFWIKKRIMKYVEKEKSKYDLNDKLFQNKIDKNPKEESTPKSRISFPERMPELEKQVLDLLFNEGKPLIEISKILNISREKVRQIKEMGLRRLKIKKTL